jgi:hypothetical protein
MLPFGDGHARPLLKRDPDARCSVDAALHRIQRDIIPDYYLLTFLGSDGEPPPADLAEMLVLGMTRAQHLARERVGRWRKAWLYLMLAGKNVLQALGLRRDDATRLTQ